MPWFCRSVDEGKTWSEPVCCVEKNGYFVTNNDRMIRLRSGRLMFPVAEHAENASGLTPGKIRLVYSDDNGYSWHLTDVKICSPFSDKTELQEPGVFELPDGRLWIYVRTAYGHQYQSFSNDNGESFTAPAPNLHFTSPDSPMLIKNISGRTLAVFNPIPYCCINELSEVWKSPKRTPLVCAVSKNGGLSFDSTGKSASDGEIRDFAENCILLEDDRSNSYCYPAAIETRDGLWVAYYHSNNTAVCLNSTKITKVLWDEVEKALAK